MEALVLSVLGTAIGLVLAHAALGQAQALVYRDGTAFWRDWSLQPRSAAFALVLAVVTAAIIGVIPALKSTGRRITADLRTLGTGVSARLGRGWTALIIVQVAVAVALLPTAVYLGYHEIRVGAIRSTFPAHEFLTASIGVAIPIRPGMAGEEYRREAVERSTVLLSELEPPGVRAGRRIRNILRAGCRAGRESRSRGLKTGGSSAISLRELRWIISNR